MLYVDIHYYDRSVTVIMLINPLTPIDVQEYTSLSFCGRNLKLVYGKPSVSKIKLGRSEGAERQHGIAIDVHT